MTHRFRRLLALLITAAPAAAQDCGPVELGRYDEHNFHSIVLDGDIACIGQSPTDSSTSGPLWFFDISDPASPQLLHFFSPGGTGIEDIVLRGKVAYLAAERKGLIAVDINDAHNPEVISTFATPGAAGGGTRGPKDVELAGRLAYVADYQEGLQVLAIDDAISHVGSIDTPGLATGVAAAGNTVYVADGDAGIQVIDVSSPEAPVIVGTVKTPDTAFRIAVAGDHAYVAADEAGLGVLDIRDPQAPEFIGWYPGARSRNVVISGNLVCAIGALGPVRIYDATDPRNLKLLTASTLRADDIVFDGVTGYMVSSEGLKTADFSDLLTPVPVSSYTTDLPRPHEVVVRDGIAYIAEETFGLFVLDVSDPSTPRLLGSHRMQEFDGPTAVALHGDYALCSSAHLGLLIFDIGDPADPQLIQQVATPPGEPSDIALAPPWAFVAGGYAGLCVFDISDMSNVRLATSLMLDHEVDEIVLHKQFILAARERHDGFTTVDISDPIAPAPVGGVSYIGGVRGMTIRDSLAFITGVDWDESGLYVFDISDVTSPQTISTLDRKCGHTVPAGQLMYAASPDGLLVIDRTDPSQLRVVGELDIPVGRIAVAGDLVVAVSYHEAIFVDVSDPTNPHAVAAIQHSDGEDVVILGDIACIASGWGVATYDVSDPSDPIHVSTLPVAAGRLAVAGDVAYLSTYSDLRVLDISDPARPSIIRTVEMPDGVGRMIVKGSNGYTPSGGKLTHFNLADPRDPIPTQLDLGRMAVAGELALRGDILFVPLKDNGLHMFDVTEPLAPRRVGSYLRGDCRHFAVDGDVIYVGGSSRLIIGDISDPTSPVEIGFLPDVGAGPVELRGNIAYTGSGLLELIDIAAPTHPRLITDYDPNGSGSIESLSLHGSLVYIASERRGLDIADVSACLPCYADCDASGSLDMFDYLCFSQAFKLSAPYADCDGNASLDMFDFLCFQDSYYQGCF